MMKEQLIYRIGGREYVKTSCLFSKDSTFNKVKREVEKIGGHFIGIRNFDRGGFLSSPAMIVEFMIPSHILGEWGKIIDKA